MAKLTNDELLEAFKEMTLIELSEFVKLFEETFDVTAAAPVAVAAAPAAAAPLAAAPDTLAWLTDDGHPLSNSEIRPDTALRASMHLGRRISLLGIPAAPILREPVLANGFSALLAQLGYYGTAPALPV